MEIEKVYQREYNLMGRVLDVVDKLFRERKGRWNWFWNKDRIRNTKEYKEVVDKTFKEALKEL